MEGNKIQILFRENVEYQLPIFLTSTAIEMGDMVPFDGDIEQIEQLCNFTYTSNGNIVTVYNTTNTNKLNRIIDSVFEIDWGDGTPRQSINILGNLTHNYTSSGIKTITIYMNNPWDSVSSSKIINLPKTTTDPTDLLSLTFDIPYTQITGFTQNYGNDYDYNADNYTGTTVFLAITKSRINEKKLYGGTYTGLTTGVTEVNGLDYDFTGYTIDNLNYIDLSDGFTYVSGNTINFATEDDFLKKLTRNEHYLGFITEPLVYSDVFIQRGKNSVSEFNLRLSEINSVGELMNYGNGYFNIKKF